jgi:hypothetical protein
LTSFDQQPDNVNAQALVNELVRVRDHARDEKRSEEAQQAQWEIDVLRAIPKDGKLLPCFIRPAVNGKQASFPDIEAFDKPMADYLLKRIEQTSNCLLRVRYAHALWLGPKHHGEHARTAAREYLRLAEVLAKLDTEQPHEFAGLEALQAIKNAYYLLLHSGQDMSCAALAIGHYVRAFNPKSTSRHKLQHDLIEIAVKDKRRFASDDLDGFAAACWQNANELIELGNTHFAVLFLHLGQRIDLRTGIRTHLWINRIGEAYERQARAAGKGNRLAVMSCSEAIKWFKQAGRADKVRELEAELIDLRRATNFSEHSYDIDVTEINRETNELAERISKLSCSQIAGYLALSRDLFPGHDYLHKLAKEALEKTVFQYIVSTQIIDSHGNTAEHVSDEEHHFLQVMQTYHVSLQVGLARRLHEILRRSINTGHFSFPGLHHVLKMDTWLTHTFELPSPASVSQQYNWLVAVVPPLREYFAQWEMHKSWPEYTPDFTLFIDSMTVRIEGMLRDLCRLHGVPTFFERPDEKGRPVQREKDMGRLLREEHIVNLLGKDDHLFFRFLFIEKTGFNLRHRVAHGLFLPQHYTPHIADLVFLAFMRLSRFGFVPRASADSEDAAGEVTGSGEAGTK